MRHYRLQIAASVATLIGFTAAAAWLAASAGLRGTSHTAAFILLCLGAATATLALVRLLRFPAKMVSSFVRGLEADDSTMRFVRPGDAELDAVAAAMDRIAAINGRTALELETRKLYYDRILRIMTHEMRNAVTPVIALSSDICDHPDRYPAAQLAEAAGVIRDQSKGIKRFLDSYYELTHLPAPQREDFDAAVFFRSVLISPGSPECRVNVALGLTINADRTLLARAVTNLVRNAFEAAASSPAPEVTVTATRTGTGTMITVADNGPGIPPDEAENLFQPFFTTKPGGSGIGLFLSRQIARLHGGDLRLTSSAHGATAILTIGMAMPELHDQ